MKKPFYTIDSNTKTIICDLVQTCKKHELGNVNFHYYDKSGNVQFNLSENKFCWDLVVNSEKRNIHGVCFYYRDIYCIISNMEIIYQYTETDLV